jgi:hypothetical protein
MSDMNIWEFNRALANRLLRNNIVNIWVGNRLRHSDSKFLQGVGVQAIGWGLINIGIAIFGLVTTRRRLDKLDDPFEPNAMYRERRNIWIALIINTPLNLVYMFGGLRFAHNADDDDDFKRGMGWGIVLQGLLLFIHDSYHLANVPDRPVKNVRKSIKI